MLYDWQPLFLTLKLAGITTAILFIIGVPLAYWMVFSKSKLRYVVEPLVSLPLVLPPTVLGFYILLAFSPKYPIGSFLENALGVRIAFSFPGLVIGSVLFSLPFMVNPIKAAMESFPASLIEAAFVLGKSKIETLKRIILPNIKPAIWVGVIMAFAHTLGEFGVVLMVGGNIPGETRTASIAIFSEVEALNYDTASFYSLVLIVLSFSILSVFYYFNRKPLRMF